MVDNEWSQCVGKLTSDSAVVYTDGGAWPNPGHGGLGVAIADPVTNDFVCLEWKYLGVDVSNWDAECAAVLRGLTLAHKIGARKVKVKSDGRFMVQVFNKIWLPNNTRIWSSYRAWEAAHDDFDELAISWIPREENQVADGLVQIVRQLYGERLAPRVDMRTVARECIVSMLNRCDIPFEQKSGFLVTPQVYIRPSPFYNIERGIVYPTMERDVFNEMKVVNRLQKRVVIGWRPIDKELHPLRVPNVRADSPLMSDMSPAPLFAFIDDLSLGKVLPFYGYRGTKIHELDGPWRTASEFFWWKADIF